MYLNETYSKVRIGKHLSDPFPIQNGLKQGDSLSQLLFNFAFEYAVRGIGIKWDIISFWSVLMLIYCVKT
jgi:hypothetical protein